MRVEEILKFARVRRSARFGRSICGNKVPQWRQVVVVLQEQLKHPRVPCILGNCINERDLKRVTNINQKLLADGFRANREKL